MQGDILSTEKQKLKVRKLEISDKSKGFIELLQQLTICDSVSDKEFEARFGELSAIGDDHVVCVIEDQLGKIIATGSVFIEKKFIRNCGKVGHIEDVVVDSGARGKQLGKKIIAFLADHARSVGCYKVILDCSTENKTFYEKCGFKQKEIQMVMYFTWWMFSSFLSEENITFRIQLGALLMFFFFNVCVNNKRPMHDALLFVALKNVIHLLTICISSIIEKLKQMMDAILRYKLICTNGHWTLI